MISNTKGSIAVEAALVVPVVIIAVMVVIYIMMIIFQICILQVAANDIAEAAALGYYYQGADLGSGISKSQIKGLGAYRRWTASLNLDEQENQKEVLQRLTEKSILKNGSMDLNIRRSNSIISQDITVIIKASYKNPLEGLIRASGLNNGINVTVRAKAVVDDPAEFIRNTDFIIETAEKVPLLEEFQTVWRGAVNRIIQYIDAAAKE